MTRVTTASGAVYLLDYKAGTMQRHAPDGYPLRGDGTPIHAELPNEIKVGYTMIIPWGNGKARVTTPVVDISYE